MLTDLLSADLAILRRLDGATDHDDKRAAADEFVDAQLALGLTLAGAPELRWEGETIDYLYETAPLIERNLGFVEAHADDTRKLLGAALEGDEWRRACERRSAFELLRELYADSSAADALARLDLGELDERLRFVGAREGDHGADVPDGIPPTHWWWWLPGAPPAED